MADGILVTKLAGLHSGTNTISGDFSVAASGFHIKDGKVVGPIKQITIAGNFYELLKNIEETCSNLQFRSGGLWLTFSISQRIICDCGIVFFTLKISCLPLSISGRQDILTTYIV